MYYCEWRYCSCTGPARRSRAEHRETDCMPFSNRTVTTTRPIAPRLARFSQAVHWATDCIPTISAQDKSDPLDMNIDGMLWVMVKEIRTSPR